tara:strand:+ start:163 stop:453 length:291 start_codon:yes stop_codon:yes gene_type:complete
MFLTSLCTPALIYMVFFLTHALIATFKDNYKHAILQFLIGFLMTLLLQLLCLRKMDIISWIIVFIPFIFYTYMIMIIYYVFGINPEKDNDLEISVS